MGSTWCQNNYVNSLFYISTTKKKERVRLCKEKVIKKITLSDKKDL